jgi:hypothetical protein
MVGRCWVVVGDGSCVSGLWVVCELIVLVGQRRGRGLESTMRCVHVIASCLYCRRYVGIIVADASIIVADASIIDASIKRCKYY